MTAILNGYKEKTVIRKLLTLSIMTMIFVISSPSWSYDMDAAQAYGEMFANVKGAACGKHLHLLPADKLITKIKKQEPLVVLDIRTPRELSTIGVTLPGTLNIPLDQLFTPKSLGALPTDRPVFVMCQSGIRSTAAATALRHIGFNNVFVVKGGLKAMINYLGPKQAYAPVKPEVKK